MINRLLGKFISVAEATEWLNVSSHVIYRLIKTHAVKAFKPAGKTSAWKIEEESLCDYVQDKLTDSPSFATSLSKWFKGVPRKKEWVQLLLLRYDGDYTVQQVVNVLGISKVTYFSWEKKALEKIKNNMYKVSFTSVKDDKFALKLLVRAALGVEDGKANN